MTHSYTDEYGQFLPYMEESYEKPKKCTPKCYVKWIFLSLLILITILLLLAFVVFPLVVMCSINVQTFLVFLNIDQPKNPEFENFAKYGANGTRNLYITVDDYYGEKDINLGIWHLVPEDLIAETNKSHFNYDESLMNSPYPVVIYFHGQIANRIQQLPTYTVLRKFFHVIAFDYRNFGDSTEATLSEIGVVSDAVQLYKWVQLKTRRKIFVWGHSLGCGISTHTVARLKDENIIPSGLVLEAPFTSIKEEAYNHPFVKIFAWLPWFKATILDPLEHNGFIFDNTKNILKVDCPIMIMNSEDDPVIPHTLGRKLAQIATTDRDPVNQGNVTYHLFPGHLGYNHVLLTSDEHTPQFIKEFLDKIF